MTFFPKIKSLKYSAGQTLIETLVALFILIMGVSAAAGLAVYALSSSTGVIKQIVANGLAREGIEAVRNMRDTNWLKDTLLINGCYDYTTSTANKANCYANWLSREYCLDPTKNNGVNCSGVGLSTATFFLSFDSSLLSPWIFNKDGSKFGLNFDSANSGNGGYYGGGSTGVDCTNGTGRSDYCRKIIITQDATAPFNQDVGALVKVQSQVWWIDKKCPRVVDYNLAPASCKIELDSYLTNWKNY
ncbi:MAG: hypothetical protein HY918_00035 [Candidatus Doudnabacteria bacterium]|nr:hypothetical protein [Candidatus Doudnabacteria bacterium]